MDTTQVDSVLDRIKYLEGLYQARKDQFDKTDKVVKELETEDDILVKTEKVLKHLTDKLIQEDLTKMDKLITYGLNTVYAGRDIKFESSIEERGKKLYIYLNTLYNGMMVDPNSKSSVHVIESVLLRLLSIIKLKKAHFIMMDETFAAVDNTYMENVSRLLKQLAEKLKMDILVVTHNPTLSTYAKNNFELELNKDILTIEKKS